ncbi:hypothetical protein AVEN_216294-2-1, partial [Araneus ventricosus]
FLSGNARHSNESPRSAKTVKWLYFLPLVYQAGFVICPSDLCKCRII